MTSKDKERLEICLRVQKSRLEKKQPFVVRESILQNIREIEEQLKQPVVEIVNTGENLKTNNPFI
jgi:hypothetical protein